MKKLIFCFLLFFLFSFLITNKAQAVTKTSGDLEVTFDEPIFTSSTIWYPGLSVGKSMTVKNKGGDNQTVSIEALNKTQTGNMAGILFFKVLESGADRYGGADNKTSQNFWDDGQVSLSGLGGGNTTTYDLTVNMNTSAGNEYQGKEAKFDLQVGFVGTTSQVTVSGGGGGGDGRSDGRSDGKSDGRSDGMSPSGGGAVFGPAFAFAPAVLGATTPSAEITSTPSPTSEGILGEQNVTKNQQANILINGIKDYWWIGLILVLILGGYFIWKKQQVD